jgi:hypothetical protein
MAVVADLRAVLVSTLFAPVFPALLAALLVALFPVLLPALLALGLLALGLLRWRSMIAAMIIAVVVCEGPSGGAKERSTEDGGEQEP